MNHVSVDARGTKKWYKEDKLHREDGPAVEWADEGKKWYKEGQLHREDGPAVEWADGYKEWWLEGKRYKEEVYWKKVKPAEKKYSQQAKKEYSQQEIKEIYEQNKTRNRCIVCNSSTIDRPICTSVIKYCRCIEGLKKIK